MNEPTLASENEIDPASTDCRQAEIFLHRYIEGELDPIRSRILSTHLASCASCRSARRELERERLWLIDGAVSAPPLSEHFREKVIARIGEDRAEAQERRRRDIFFRVTGAAAAVLILAYAAFQSLEWPRSVPEAARETAEVVSPLDAGVPASAPSPFPVQLVRFASFPITEATDEPVDCIDDELQVAEAAGREAALGVDPAGAAGAWRTACATPWGSNFGEVAQMAAELDATAPRWIQIGANDPCRPDPNQDGKAGWDDVAILCQTIIRGCPVHFLEGGHGPGDPIDDCRDLCVRGVKRRVEFGS